MKYLISFLLAICLSFPTAASAATDTQISEWKRGVVEVESGATGFVVKDGYVVTNAHTVDLSKDLTYVKTFQGGIYQAKLAAYDEILDLAILKTDLTDDYFNLKLDDLVAYDDLEYTVIGQTWKTSGWNVSTGKITNIFGWYLLGTSVPVDFGNSGSPMIDPEGNVVGVVRSMDPFTKEAFVISPGLIRKFLENNDIFTVKKPAIPNRGCHDIM